MGKSVSPAKLIERAMAICLALPEAAISTGGSPALEHHARYAAVFRVAGRSFSWLLDNHHGDDRIALWCKSVPAARDGLIKTNPLAFFVPPYLGGRGWIGVRLDGGVPWDEVEDIVEQSYRSVAPRRLVTQLGS